MNFLSFRLRKGVVDSGVVENRSNKIKMNEMNL